MFAYTAKQDGKVISVDDSLVEVEYEDGSIARLEIGRRFGVAADATYPHQVNAAVKEGQKLKKGQLVTYNENFFEVDPLDPTQAVWKAGVITKTALLESTDTLEDSSAISQEVAEALETNSTQVREIRVAFEQTVHNLARAGESVEPESILCNIENPVTSDNKLFDEETLETLQLLSAQSPKSKKRGVVERVEVFYNGDKADMSDSLRKVANASDRAMIKRSKAVSGEGYGGRVDHNYRVSGKNLDVNNAVIKVYITGPLPAGSGDKGVFANQMKTVFSRVMSGTNQTEDGTDLGAIFGYKSITDRVTNSPEIMGTTNTLLKVLSKKVANIYRGNE